MDTTQRGGLRLLHAGDGPRTALLLHGLGATADVWRDAGGLLANGGWRVLAPDLPGHGGSAPPTRYAAGQLGVAVSGVVDTDDEVWILGHSLGGILGLLLGAGWFGLRVSRVVALGTKVAWPEQDLARMHARSRRPPEIFTDRDSAVARHLRVSGLDGLLAPDDPRVAAGVRQEAGAWRLALDPAAWSFQPPDATRVLAAVAPGTTVVLARGEHDPMVSEHDYEVIGGRAVSMPGLGHSAHVQDPQRVIDLVAG